MVPPQEHMCYQDLCVCMCVCVCKRHVLYALNDLSKNLTQLVGIQPVPWISLKCKSSCVSSLNPSCACSRLSSSQLFPKRPEGNYPDAPGWGLTPCTPTLSARVTGEIQMFKRGTVSEIASLS